MKLSLIIPVYNIEEHLPVCIDSILNQGFKDYEVLLINDGSTDNSGVICDNYAVKDERIKVFHQENIGVSSARNVGIQNAKGDWICFVDGDDWIEKDALEKLDNDFRNRSFDLLIARSFSIKDDLELVTEEFHFSKDLVGKESTGISTVIDLGYNRGSVWGVLYNRDFLCKKNILFPEKIKNSEDSIFFTLCLIYADSVQFTDTHFYNVYERLGSASRNWTQERVACMVRGIEYINTYKVANIQLSAEAKNILDYTIYRVISSIYNNLYFCFSFKVFIELTQSIKREMILKLDTGEIKTSKSKVKFLNFSVYLFGISVLVNALMRNKFTK